MSDYNGWKNQATWSINVLHTDRISRLLEEGHDEEEIKSQIINICQPNNMNIYGRDLFLSAWATIDWYTIFKLATEEMEQTA